MIKSCELVNNLLKGGKVDRIGIYDHGPWKDALAKWVQEGYPVENSDSDGSQNPVLYAEHFNYDMLSVGGWFDALPLAGVREIVKETDEWVMVRNGAGAIIKNWKNKVTTPEYVDFSMTSQEIWEKNYKPYLLEAGKERLDIEGTKKRLEKYRKKGFWTFYGHQFIWEYMRCSMGNYCMLESLLLNPGWIHDFCRVYTDVYKKMFRILIEEAGRPDGIWIYEDLAYKNGLFCSPKVLEEVIFIYYKELIDFFSQYDLPVILHSDGRIDEGLPLIINAGFAGVNPMEVKAGCDTFKYAEIYGDKIAFIGGFDARILESGDRSLIKREIIKTLERMKSSGGRFMFGVDHSIPSSVSYEDFKYAIEVYREHMMY